LPIHPHGSPFLRMNRGLFSNSSCQAVANQFGAAKLRLINAQNAFCAPH
jgi:hypothetical protein